MTKREMTVELTGDTGNLGRVLRDGAMTVELGLLERASALIRANAIDGPTVIELLHEIDEALERGTTSAA